MEHDGIVVIGAGLAGAVAADTLRAEGYTGDLTLVGAEPEAPYHRPGLSKQVLVDGELPELPLVRPGDHWDRIGVRLVTDREAVSLDAARRTVSLSDGAELGYDQLLLATGLDPRGLHVPGAWLGGVHLLRSWRDALALRGALAAARSVVVVGAGWLGSEVAASARARGLDVALVEPMATPLMAAVGAEVGAVFADHHRAHGIDLRTGAHVAALTGRPR